MGDDTTPAARPDTNRFEALEELQNAHAKLVQEVGKEVLGKSRRIRDFIADGAATGVVLDAKEDRAAAQGLRRP